MHTCVNVRLIEGKVLHITVSDSGAGFDLAAARPVEACSGGFGLFSIPERLGLIGGRLEIVAQASDGQEAVQLAGELLSDVDPDGRPPIKSIA